MVVFLNVSPQAVSKLTKLGFKKEAVKTIYEVARLKHNAVTAILYTSGKLVLQGSPTEINAIAPKINKLKLGEEIKPEKLKKETGWIIGSDESLKGDTFGGVVVAAVKADQKGREELSKMGVKDSKLLEDKEILLLAGKIRQIVSCEIRSLLPEEYNVSGGITGILNYLHNDCAKYLAPGKHVVDKYPGCTIGDIREEQAESKYVEVAAASVLARAGALKQLDYLSTQAGFSLPKGSTHVAHALHELKERGLPFHKFVKMDFNNVREFLKQEKE